MVPPSAPLQWGQGKLFEPCSGARIALRRKSHHPLLAVLAEAPFVLHAWLLSSFTLKLHGWGDTRRFVVVRELEREDKSPVGRRLINVPGYTFRVWVTNRTEDAATLWRDYNGRATVVQRIEKLKTTCTPTGFAPAS